MANLAQGGTAAQILTLLQDNAIPALCSALKQSNIDLLNNALETLYALLNTVSAWLVFSSFQRFSSLTD